MMFGILRLHILLQKIDSSGIEIEETVSGNVKTTQMKAFIIQELCAQCDVTELMM